jgi:isocitrate/isopropylmalate dehydrogenase
MKNMDLIIVRENTEGLYVQKEKGKNRVTAEKVVSKKESERIIKFAFEYAEINKRKRITCVHKANVLRKSDGMFRRIFYEIADGYDVDADDCLVDACAMHLIKNPEKFDVIVTMNLYGDILSDEAAALVGGLGFIPGANIGEDYAIFEPAHGSAPDIAGKGIANPTAMIMSGGMMLRYLGMGREGDIIEKALRKVFEKGIFTPDVDGKHGAKRFTKEVIKEIKQLI